MEEKEIKIRVTKQTFERLLNDAKKTLKLHQESKQKDIYFDTEEMFINNLNRGLRVRFDDNLPKNIEFKSLFYNKNTRQDNPWFIEEISYEMPLKERDFPSLLSIFNRLGLKKPNLVKSEYGYKDLKEILESVSLTPKITVTKHRQIYKNNEANFVFDFIEELGYFIEIETTSELDPMNLVKEAVGTEAFQFIRNGYNDMAATNIPNCLTNETKQQLFKLNPKWNVLVSEVNLVNSLLTNSKSE